MYELKDSRIEWIGNIPKHWDVYRVKDGFYQKKSKAFQKNPTILSLARDGVKVRDISNNEGQIASSYYEYNPVDIDDMLLNPMDLVSGDNCSISKVKGVISPAYINLRYKEGFNPEYYNYYFKVQYWKMAFFAHGKGVSFENRWTLNADTLMKFPIIVPPYDEQTRIAQYLEEKCMILDELYKNINNQIELLDNYKKSIIFETVTKGINSTEYKESNIEWIGKIPKDWKVDKIKYHLRRNEPRNPGNTIVLSVYREYGVVPKDSRDDNHNVTSEDVSKYKYLKKGNLVINKMKAWQGSLAVSEYTGIVSPAYYIYEFLDDSFNKKYFHYLIRNCYKGEFRRISGGIREGQWDLSAYNFENTLILIPPKEEQNQIVTYLDKKCEEIEKLVSIKENQLNEIEKYKKSMIFEIITGKKEI